VLALDTLFWRVAGTIVGTVPPRDDCCRRASDWLSQSTIHPDISFDRIVETNKKNGCFKKVEENPDLLDAARVSGRS
jgi:hypothetical protein